MESVKTFPLIKQEFIPNPGLAVLQQLSQKNQLAQNLGYFGPQIPQQNLGQPLGLTGNQRILSQILMTNPIIDGKVPVDPKFLQSVITQNEMMKNQINSLLAQREKLFQSLNSYEQKTMSKHGKQMTLGLEKTDSEKKKRFRRSAKNIFRMFQCPTEKCSKSYGSEGSLHQHIRLKHPEFDITTWIQSRIAEGDHNKEGANELNGLPSGSESMSQSSAQPPSLKVEEKLT